MMPAIIACPFNQWGIDIVGPFPQGTHQKKFLIVVVEYFTKWVTAEALATITEGRVKAFIWRNIVCRFGLPRIIVSNNGAQFSGKKLKD